MCNKFDTARKITLKYVLSGKGFTLEEVERNVQGSNGVLRISPGVSIKKYLETLCSDGFVQYGDDYNEYVST